MQFLYLDSNYTILVLPRMYSSDIYQVGETPGIRSFRCSQGAPDRPNSLLLYKDKCQAVPIQCTPANYYCSANKNITLAGSGIARCGGGEAGATPTKCGKQII